jgi:hypothetical protein
MNRAVETNLAMIRHVAARLGHLLPDSASQQRIPILMGRITAIANLL